MMAEGGGPLWPRSLGGARGVWVPSGRVKHKA